MQCEHQDRHAELFEVPITLNQPDSTLLGRACSGSVPVTLSCRHQAHLPSSNTRRFHAGKAAKSTVVSVVRHSSERYREVHKDGEVPAE